MQAYAADDCHTCRLEFCKSNAYLKNEPNKIAQNTWNNNFNEYINDGKDIYRFKLFNQSF